MCLEGLAWCLTDQTYPKTSGREETLSIHGETGSTLMETRKALGFHLHRGSSVMGTAQPLTPGLAPALALRLILSHSVVLSTLYLMSMVPKIRPGEHPRV